MFIVDIEDDERRAFREVVRDVIEQNSPESAVRAAVDTDLGYDPTLWQTFAELGLPSLTISDEFGGAGAGATELAVAFEELGRGLIPGPYLSTIALGATLLESLGDAALSTEILPTVSEGSAVIAVALSEHGLDWVPRDANATVRQTEGGFALTTQRRFVLDGAAANFFLVPVTDNDGVSVYLIDGSSDGVTRTTLTTLDLTARLADVGFDNAPARLVGGAGAAADAIELAVRRGILALAAQQCGAAEHLMTLTLDYAKIRYQFDRPIGGFQAIKHKLADMAFDLERMKSALRQLVLSTEAESPDVLIVSHLTKAFVSEAYFRIAAETIQIHGGIGFTWEHQAHLYYRNAKSTEFLLGSPHDHRERMLQLLEAQTA